MSRIKADLKAKGGQTQY